MVRVWGLGFAASLLPIVQAQHKQYPRNHAKHTWNLYMYTYVCVWCKDHYRNCTVQLGLLCKDTSQKYEPELTALADDCTVHCDTLFASPDICTAR